MAATTATIKADTIQADKMKFRTQIVNGKPQIFFDDIEKSTMKTKPKRNNHVLANANRPSELQKTKGNPGQNGMIKSKTKSDAKNQNNEDNPGLGVYMTMDELAELVKAVKENAKTDDKPKTELKDEPPKRFTNEVHTVPHVPKLDIPLEPPAPAPPAPSVQPPDHVSPREQALSIMADKKRQKWMREKAEIERMQLEIEYDQLKHQLSPRHKEKSVSPERSTFQYDFPQPTNKPPPIPTYKQTESQHDVSQKANEASNDETARTRLLERKQQQWKQEQLGKLPMWDPFGRPGAGAPNPNEIPSRITQPTPNPVVLNRPPVPTQNHQSALPAAPTYAYGNQATVPAAMRRNLFFGDVRFEEDVKAAKEIERRQWLDDLQKQVEENKRKKYPPLENEYRRKEFLNENVQPLLQEAANRHYQSKDNSLMNNTDQNFSKYNQNNSFSQRPHERIPDMQNEVDTNGRRSQLFDKLQRNGFHADFLSQTLPDPKTTGEKLFGPNYDATARSNTNNRVDSLHLNVNGDRQQPYRSMDPNRDGAVNTVDTTFRSDHSVYNEQRAGQYRTKPNHHYDESDLPPQATYNYARNMKNPGNKRNSRMKSHDNSNPVRRASTTTYNSNTNTNGATSQMSSHPSNQGPIDMHNRPKWNYHNPQHREYVPNSKRDPHYEKRQRVKHFQEGNFDGFDDVQKKTCYNRWNSDSELQQQKKTMPANRIHSTITKQTPYGHQKDESIMNLLKLQNRQQEAYVPKKQSSNHHTKLEHDVISNRASSLDRYENYPNNIHTEDNNFSERAYSPPPPSHSRDASPHRQLQDVSMIEPSYQSQLENASRQNISAQPTSYNAPSRQEFILQQLSTIKENLVRRQRELLPQ